MNPAELDKLLRDSYANYVIQTAMDYADAETKSRLIDHIRPILPAIRQTPYGRRISGKIQEYDNRLNGGINSALSPSGTMSPGQLTSTPFRSGGSGSMGAYTSPMSQVGNYGVANMTSPTPHRHHGPLNMLAQVGQQQTNGFNQAYGHMGHGARGSRSSGMGNY